MLEQQNSNSLGTDKLVEQSKNIEFSHEINQKSTHHSTMVRSKAELEQVWNENDSIFERLIIMIPYKSPSMVKSIEETFEKLNLKGLNLPNARYLSTKEFS
jgi:hypothetical protein